MYSDETLQTGTVESNSLLSTIHRADNIFGPSGITSGREKSLKDKTNDFKFRNRYDQLLCEFS